MSKKSKKQVFLLYVCDDWKTTSSMSLVCATTSVTRLKRVIAECILDGTMEYDTGARPKLSPRQQAIRFKKEWKTETSTTINDCLLYGYYEYVYDGERI